MAMAQVEKIEGQVKVNCCTEKVFQMFHGKQPETTNLCSDKIVGVDAQQGDWSSVGTIRKWDYYMDGKRQSLTEKFESVDMENKIIVFQVLEGDWVKDRYKSFRETFQVIPQGEGSCLATWRIEYEKENDDIGPPQKELDYVLDLIKQYGTSVANA